jgi:tetratricopeptide (TPR) repeat protein
LRGATDEAAASFQEGMKSYVAGDYDATIPSLRRAARLDTERSDIAFFLAASELLAGNTAAAIGEFARTIAMGDTPFLEDAHFFLAKAHLAQGDADRARAELTAVRSLQGERASEADDLLVQLESAGSE